MSARRNLSIGQRLGLGFGVLVLLFVAMSVTVLRDQSRSADAQRAFTDRIAPLNEAASSLERSVLRVAIAARSYAITSTRDRLDAYRRAVITARQNLRSLDGLPKEPDGEARAAAAAARINQYLSSADAFVASVPGAAAAGPEESLAETREDAMSELQAFTALQRAKREVAVATVESARISVSKSMMSMAIGGVVLFSLLAVVITQSVREPVRELLVATSAMEGGNWRPALALAPSAQHTDEETRDELVRLSRAFGRAARAIEARERRLDGHGRVAAAAASTLDRHVLADAALRITADHVGAEVGALFWNDRESGMLVPVSARGLSDPPAALSAAEGLPGRAVSERRTLVVSNPDVTIAPNVHLGVERRPARSIAAIPFVFQDDVHGVLVLASLNEFDADAIAFLNAAAEQLGIGLQNVAAYERIQRLLQELADKAQEIQAQNEELQAQNEELQAQNEEIQAQQEELHAQTEELHAQTEELQAQTEEIQAQNQQLQEQTSVLADADRRKDEFLGVLAHELRNPLAGISNSLYLLAQKGIGSEHVAQAREVMERQSRLLARLIDDLLDVTRISQGKIELRRELIDARDVVKETVEDCHANAARAGVTLHTDLPEIPLHVFGDRARLAQIIGNMLDNAIKFSLQNSQVVVAATRSADHGEVELRVTDAGAGMESGEIANLFQPFRQGTIKGARGNPGLGLGLALVKALVELHGGRVQASSDGPGRGSTFMVHVPLLQAAPVGKEATSRSPLTPLGEIPSRRILIIEDNTDAASGLRAALELHGHAVRVAGAADEGVATAREFAPHVLFCDIGLPMRDGYDVARAFRSDERLRGVHLVALSGYATEQDRERSRAAGFDHHFAKPADIAVLHSLVASLETSRTERASA